MTLARLDKRVEDLEARAEALVERMEGAAERYLDAIAPWVQERFTAEVSAAVVAAPEVSQSLGPEGLTRLRRGLEALVAGAPELVRKRIGSARAWPHRWDREGAALVPGLFGAKGASGKRRVEVPSFLESRLRLLLGTSGRLLARHGFERHVRRTFGRAYLRTDYHPPEYLSRSLEGHDRFLPLLGEYADLCDEYVSLAAEVRAAGRDRAARAAEDLWKKA
jgi:hypothetical protein